MHRSVWQYHTDLIQAGIDEGATLVAGGIGRPEHLSKGYYVKPTVFANVSNDMTIAREEIFGPVLPVLDYIEYDEIYDTVAKLPQHPLAAYVFSESRDVQNEFTERMQFGGGCINQCVLHLANPNLPFGGVGESGMSAYHGFHGFERFSHKKGVMKSATWLDLPLVYAPYKDKLKWLRRIMK